MIGESFQSRHSLRGRLCRIAADEHHEHRHQRQAHRDDDRREDIAEDDAHEQHDGHHCSRGQSRNHGGEVVVEVVDSTGDRDRRIRPRASPTAQKPGKDREPQSSFRFGGQPSAQAAVEPETSATQQRAEDSEDHPQSGSAVVDDGPNQGFGDEDDSHRPAQGGEHGQCQPPPAGRQFEQDRQRRAHEWIATGSLCASGMWVSAMRPRNIR